MRRCNDSNIYQSTENYIKFQKLINNRRNKRITQCIKHLNARSANELKCKFMIKMSYTYESMCEIVQ